MRSSCIKEFACFLAWITVSVSVTFQPLIFSQSWPTASKVSSKEKVKNSPIGEALNVWNGFLNTAAGVVKVIRDTCIILLEVLSPAAPVKYAAQLLLLSFLNSLFRAMVDDVLLQANLSPGTYARIIILEVIIPT